MIALYKHLEDKNFWYGKYLACTEAYLVALRHAPEIPSTSWSSSTATGRACSRSSTASMKEFRNS